MSVTYNVYICAYMLVYDGYVNMYVYYICVCYVHILHVYILHVYIYMHVVYTCIADVHVDDRYIDVYRYVEMINMCPRTYVACVYIMYMCVWYMTHVYMS